LNIVLPINLVHEHDIAHRDIKPDNMMIAADGSLKIVDFGVSEMFSKGNAAFNKTAGSPAFYPPECCGCTLP
jgi:[calcium/calmodulin-dependent protein kinase] kinase